MDLEQKLTQLHNYITCFTNVPDEEWQLLVDNCASKTIQKDEYILQAGEIPQSTPFICSGLMRMFYRDDQEREFNRGFRSENEFVSSYTALKLGIPSLMYIQALEKTELLDVRYPHGFSSAFWDFISLKQLELAFYLKEKREAEFLIHTPEQRYINFLEEYGGLAERLNNYHIASYLGITPVSLSRIRTKIKIQKK